MGLARELVDLEARLRERADVELFAPVEGSALLTVPECAAITERVRLDDRLSVVRLCLQALRIQHTEMMPHLLDAELVATLPPEIPGLARPTARVIYEMVSRAKSEVILLGYELTDRALIDLLATTSRQGADIIMICDRARGVAQKILDSWPADSKQPTIFQNRERQGDAPYASMHAKCLLVDGADLLITSANFTFHGLHGNVEIGVRLSGAPAGEARKIFAHLVDNGVVSKLDVAAGD